MGCQCSKLIPCCWNSQFKAAVLEAPDIGGLIICPFFGVWCFVLMEKRIISDACGLLPLLQIMRRRARLITCLHFVNSHLSNLKMRHLVLQWSTLCLSMERRLQMLFIKGNWKIRGELLLSASIGWPGLMLGSFW